MSAFRILLATPWYFPETIGGTEMYVRGLALRLKSAGLDVTIAAPTQRPLADEYRHDGIAVLRYPAPEARDGEIRSDRPEPAAWVRLLEQVKPDIVDLHSLTTALELSHLKAARARGARTVVTMHLPDAICARGTFMRFGKTPCDGDLARQPCTACRLEKNGVTPTIGWLLGHVPAALGDLLVDRAAPLALRRALSASRNDRERRRWLQALIACADRVVAPSQWLIDALRRNGAPSNKVVLCRQGAEESPQKALQGHRDRACALRVGFVGRCDPVKGLHVLVDAVLALPRTVAIEIHVWAVARDAAHESYRLNLLKKTQGDRRFIFHEETTDPGSIYSQIDALAVPSLWLETGPLVVLEAQAARLPIVGSDLGGIAERVNDGRNGILVPAGDSRRLGDALAMLAAAPDLLESMRPTEPPRGAAAVAADTLRTYLELLRIDAAASVIPSVARCAQA